MSQDQLTLDGQFIRFAWHDAVCPEADECRSRHMHALSYHAMFPVLDRFLVNLGVLDD